MFISWVCDNSQKYGWHSKIKAKMACEKLEQNYFIFNFLLYLHIKKKIDLHCCIIQ